MKNITILFLILSALAAESIMAQVPNYLPQNGLVAWYPFSGNADDESGAGNNLGIDGAELANDRSGKAKSAYYFDGVNDCLFRECLLKGLADYSLSVWVSVEKYPADSTLGAELVSNGFGHSNGSGLKLDTSSVGVINYGNCFNVTASTFKPSEKIWHHYVCTKSGDEYKMYVDGTLSSSGSCATRAFKGYFVVGAVRGDSMATAFSNFFNGHIDDIGFWNRALTPDEAAAIYNNSVTGVDETASVDSYSIYPNPAQNQITVQTPGDAASRTYTVTDYLGKQVMTGEVSSQNATVDISSLPVGMYLFHIGDSSARSFTVIK